MNLEQPGGFGNGPDMLARLAPRSAPSAPPPQPRRFAIIVGKQRSGHRTGKTGIVDPQPQIVALLSLRRAGLPGIADPLPAEHHAKGGRIVGRAVVIGDEPQPLVDAKRAKIAFPASFLRRLEDTDDGHGLALPRLFPARLGKGTVAGKEA